MATVPTLDPDDALAARGGRIEVAQLPEEIPVRRER
jgi:hypothetical protein